MKVLILGQLVGGAEHLVKVYTSAITQVIAQLGRLPPSCSWQIQSRAAGTPLAEVLTGSRR